MAAEEALAVQSGQVVDEKRSTVEHTEFYFDLINKNTDELSSACSDMTNTKPKPVFGCIICRESKPYLSVKIQR